MDKAKGRKEVVRVKKTKNPNLQMRVMYVSAAGRKIVKVRPDQGMLRIGTESFKVGPEHRFPGKGKFDVVVVQGQSEPLPVWRSSPVGSFELDGVAFNNAVKQFHTISEGGNKTTAISWVQVGLSTLLFLAIIGVGIKLNGDFDSLDSSIDALTLEFKNNNPNDATVVQPGQPIGQQNLGQAQQAGPP